MKMFIVLLLMSGSAMAQTYDLKLDLDGQIYQGYFTYTPDYLVNVAGQTILGPGTFTNVSISDPYAGTLNSAFDVYDGNNVQTHELWFSNGKPYGTIGINIKNALGGAWDKVTGAIAYYADGALDYNSCGPCSASIREIGNGLARAPEIDVSGTASALTLLAGCLIVLVSKIR